MAGHIGSFLIALAFSASVIGGVSYAVALRNSSEKYLNVARGSFYLMVFAVMFASAALMYLILGHHFEYHYVWAHSSMSLAKPFLVASFYSGQEGSFLLWSLLTALIGVFVLGYAQRFKYEAEAMSVYMFVITLLLLILVIDSPFETIYSVFADQVLAADFIPKDGRGLNPQLENLWITIHPPILFTGFASMTVPLCLCNSWVDSPRLSTMDFRGTAVDAFCLHGAWLWHYVGRMVGVRNVGMGRLLGVGSG